MVRLRLQHQDDSHTTKAISIPLWCDCDILFLSALAVTITAISIPLWCDCDVTPPEPRKYFEWNFNPTMVRLRLCTALKKKVRCCDFNPTMVRLRLKLIRKIYIDEEAFQSHYGAIATEQLKEKAKEYALISIPLWCDCDEKSPNCAIARIANFNPTMVRLRLCWVLCC